MFKKKTYVHTLKSSNSRLLLKKSFFSFFTLTPSHMWLKRPVYRGFKCEGKCEGKCFTLTLPAGKYPACQGFMYRL